MLLTHQRMGASMSGFGRKGLGGAPPMVPSGHTAQTGLDRMRNTARGQHPVQPLGGDIPRKVDAFRAAERTQRSESGISDVAAGYRNTVRPKRSLFLAYLLWFIGGQVSAHRFYLGAYRSAFAQFGLLVFPLALALATPEGSFNAVGPILAISLIAWGLWV